MPMTIYHIGDKVYAPSHGRCYVVCQTHYITTADGDKIPAYLLYVPQMDTDFVPVEQHLCYDCAVKLIERATPAAIDKIRNNILALLQETVQTAVCPRTKIKHRPGDIVFDKNNGFGIVLSRNYDHPYDESHQYYHVYYATSDMFAFTYRLEHHQAATNETKQQAHDILVNKLLIPIFTGTQ